MTFKLIFFIFCILLSFSGLSQTYYRLDNESGEELLLTVEVNSAHKTFVAHTRKDALKELAGTFTYLIAKTAGKLKYPEIVHCEGTIVLVADTTFYTGTFSYLDKSYTIKAKSWKERFSGTITDNRFRTHPLSGDKVATDKPLKDYSTIIDKAFSLTENYHFDSKLVTSDEWKDFKKEVDRAKNTISDDYEMGALLFWHSKKLPTGAYEIKKTNDKQRQTDQRKSYVLRDLQGKAVLVELNELPEEAADMDQFWEIILKKNLPNLVIDARGRKNPNIKSIALLANHLTNSNNLWGYWLTRQGMNMNLNPTFITSFEKSLKDGSLFSLNQLNNNDKGYYLKPESALPTFKGKVFVLIDSRTSREAEVLAICLKNHHLATLVGQKTSGSPLLIQQIEVIPKYKLNIQIAQFYDTQGKSYLNQGIDPDMQVSNEDALGFLMKKLN